MKRWITIAAVCCGVVSSVWSEELKWWGTYKRGYYGNEYSQLRFFAVSYRGELDVKRVLEAGSQAADVCFKEQKTHENIGSGALRVMDIYPGGVGIIGCVIGSPGDPSHGANFVASDGKRFMNGGSWPPRPLTEYRQIDFPDFGQGIFLGFTPPRESFLFYRFGLKGS